MFVNAGSSPAKLLNKIKSVASCQSICLLWCRAEALILLLFSDCYFIPDEETLQVQALLETVAVKYSGEVSSSSYPGFGTQRRDTGKGHISIRQASAKSSDDLLEIAGEVTPEQGFDMIRACSNWWGGALFSS